MRCVHKGSSLKEFVNELGSVFQRGNFMEMEQHLHRLGDSSDTATARSR